MGNAPSQPESRPQRSYEELLQIPISPLAEPKVEEIQVMRQDVVMKTPRPPPRFMPGVYVLLNCASGSALDLSGGDSRSIIGFDSHGLGNQQVRSYLRIDGLWS